MYYSHASNISAEVLADVMVLFIVEAINVLERMCRVLLLLPTAQAHVKGGLFQGVDIHDSQPGSCHGVRVRCPHGYGGPTADNGFADGGRGAVQVSRCTRSIAT